MNKDKVESAFEEVMEELEELYEMYSEYITGDGKEYTKKRMDIHREVFYKALK